MTDLNEQGKRLGQKIRLYTTKKRLIGFSKTDDHPCLWRKQDFIAMVLLNASEQACFAPDKQGLQKVSEEFTSETNIVVDLEALFERDWLRFVMNIVCIPSSISGSVYAVKKIKDCKHELLFLRAIKKDKNNSLTISEFAHEVDQYQKNNGIRLDIDKAIESHLLSKDEEKGIIKITNVEYYAPVIDHWNDFQFLVFLYDKIYGSESNLLISKDKLEAIYSNHVENYALAPELPEILASGLGKEIPEGCVISLFERRYCSDETVDEAGAILWRKLCDTYRSLQPDEILSIWCRKMILKCDHNSAIYKYLNHGEKDQFNRAAVELIMKQTDLPAGPHEYRKALLDYHMTRDLTAVQYAERLKNAEFIKDPLDAFDTMKAISNAQRGATDDYLYLAQSSRNIISYLVGQIVMSHSCEYHNLDRINDLTRDIQTKPYLLWTLCFWVWEWKPELIPLLMKNTAITSVLFSMVRKMHITEDVFDSPAEIKFRITSELFKHALSILQAVPQLSPELKAKIVFDCLLTVTIPEFQIRGQDPEAQRKMRSDAGKLAKEIKQEFADRPRQSLIDNDHALASEKYYPELLKDLFALVKTLKPENKYNNGSMDFQYAKISLLLFLSELSQKVPVNAQHLQLSSYNLAKALLDCYLTTISATTITTLDYDTWTQVEVIPTFYPASQNLEAVNWSTAFLLLERENLSSGFLHPAGLKFDDDGDEYDSYNRFIVAKLRAQLRILIITYKQILSKASELRLFGTETSSSLIRLQNAILDIAIPYSVDEPEKRRFNIFDKISERSTIGFPQDELMPLLGEIANYFPLPERERLISSLLRTDRLIRTVKLIEEMSSEEDQGLLLKQLNKLNLQEELKGLNIPELQYILSTLSSHLQFQDKAREVLVYWEKRIVSGNNGVLSNDIKITTYRMKLLHAFQENNLKGIEDVPDPVGDLYLYSKRIYPRNEKDFYRALYFFKNDDPEQAYNLYNDLAYRKDGDTTVIALNRFAAKIKWAEKETDKSKKNNLFSEALKEWYAYENQSPEGIAFEHVEENIFYNKLVAFDALEMYDDFDSIYTRLSYISRTRSGFFEIGVKNRLTRKMNPEAIFLIKEAMGFHRLQDGSIPSFIQEMNDLAVSSHDPETLKSLFDALLISNPENLVKLIPNSVNRGNDVNSYILDCIVTTAGEMLSKINSINEIHYEDKYTDQMIFGLNVLMKFHHWKVSPARGGFSNSNLNNPGEIDFAIYGSANQELAVVEAMNLSGENNAEVYKHSTKIFNYTPSKQGLFLLIYYKGKEKDFVKNWEKYQNSILNMVEFPESYSLIQDSFLDLSENHPNAAIRFGRTMHDQKVSLYHIFVNINYKAK